MAMHDEIDEPVFRFERVGVWQDAADFASKIYRTTRRFPSDEKFGLVSQMRRARVSVAANIAEGAGRGSDADYARFVSYAYASLLEVVSHLRIAFDQDFLTANEHSMLRAEANTLAKRLARFRDKLIRDANTNV